MCLAVSTNNTKGFHLTSHSHKLVSWLMKEQCIECLCSGPPFDFKTLRAHATACVGHRPRVGCFRTVTPDNISLYNTSSIINAKVFTWQITVTSLFLDWWKNNVSNACGVLPRLIFKPSSLMRPLVLALARGSDASGLSPPPTSLQTTLALLLMQRFSFDTSPSQACFLIDERTMFRMLVQWSPIWFLNPPRSCDHLCWSSPAGRVLPGDHRQQHLFIQY